MLFTLLWGLTTTSMLLSNHVPTTLYLDFVITFLVTIVAILRDVIPNYGFSCFCFPPHETMCAYYIIQASKGHIRRNWKLSAFFEQRFTNPDASSPLYALVTKRPSNIPLLNQLFNFDYSIVLYTTSYCTQCCTLFNLPPQELS